MQSEEPVPKWFIFSLLNTCLNNFDSKLLMFVIRKTHNIVILNNKEHDLTNQIIRETIKTKYEINSKIIKPIYNDEFIIEHPSSSLLHC
jgi:hypothetical protein